MASYSLKRRTLLVAMAGAGLCVGGAVHAQGLTGDEPALPETLDSWIDAFGRPMANVTINGEGPFRFLVDTGSNTTVLAMRHALRLGAPMLGVATVNGTTGSAEMPVALVERLETGAVRKSALRVALLEDEALSRADGILGADVFAGRRLMFDIGEQIVRIERSRVVSRFSHKRNLRVRNGLLAEVRGGVGRTSTKLMLDTGAQKSMINPVLSETLRKSHPALRRAGGASVVGVTGHVMVGEFMELPDIDFGTVRVKEVTAVAVDAPIFHLWGLEREPAMIVGVDVLSRAASFSIDYGAGEFEATPLAMIAAAKQGRLI